MLEEQNFLLSFLSIVSLFFAYNTISETHPVRAAFSLIVVFLSTAMHWFILEASFLSVLLVLVYVGAVMVLFLFVIMMIHGSPQEAPPFKKKIFDAVLAVTFICFVINQLYPSLKTLMHAMPNPEVNFSVEKLALNLFTEYGVALELAGLVLFVAMISAVALTYRGTTNRKLQSIHQQNLAHKNDRLVLVKSLKP